MPSWPSFSHTEEAKELLRSSFFESEKSDEQAMEEAEAEEDDEVDPPESARSRVDGCVAACAVLQLLSML